MRTRILSVVLACLLVTGLVGTMVFASEDASGNVYSNVFTTTVIAPIETTTETTADRVVSTDATTVVVDITTAATTETVVTPQPSEYAKGVVFKKDSGFKANTYTGYVEGVEPGDTAKDLYDSMENIYGVYFKRDNVIHGYFTDELKHGDMLARTSDGHNIAETFTVIFMGDSDMSSAVNLTDASTMLKVIASWENVEMDEVASDVDGNGIVNLSDVSIVLKKIAGWDVEFADPIIPGNPDVMIKGSAKMHGKNPTMGYGPISLSDGIHYDLAVKFNVNEKEYATSLSVLCHSLADNEGNLTFSVYKWAGDFDTTVAAMPIISETFIDFKDNSKLVLDLKDTAGKGLVEGEYLFRIHEGYDKPDKAATGVGVYFYNQYGPAEDTGMKTFLNCKEFNIGIEADISYYMDR